MSDIKVTHNQFIGIYENVLSEDTCKNVIELFECDLNDKVDKYGDTQFDKQKMGRYDYQKLYLSLDKSNEIVTIVNDALDTEFLWQGLRVQPKAGTVSIFPASFTHTHRGNPVYSCDKYIATGWYTLYE